MPAFGRIPQPDARNAQFPMRALLTVSPPLRSKFWPSGGLLDQGDQGICVGAAWEAFLRGSPIRTLNGPTMEEIYDISIRRDIWFDNDNDNHYPRTFGTSVLAGAKALEELGHLEGGYHWAENSEDARDWIAWKSPIVAGLTWKTGMMKTDSKQYVNLSGVDEGGHAIYVPGYSLLRDAFRFRQSWGDRPDYHYGFKGWAWIRREHFAELLADSGEACAALQKRVI